MVRTRAERRHHHKRMLDKVRNFTYLKYMKDNFTQEEYEKYINKLVENRKSCSCWMCGNPRKYTKEKTLQEKKFDKE